MLGWDRYQAAVQDQAAARGLTSQEVHVSAGDVIVWHPLLLHGGAPHHAAERTRRSFVMHVTPPDTPVYHQDYFFNPSRDAPTAVSINYAQHHGRKLVNNTIVDFAHEYNIRSRDLVRPGSGLASRLATNARRPVLQILRRTRDAVKQ